MKRFNLMVALESAGLTGEVEIEDEKVFYGKLSKEGLAKLKEMAEVEHQEQYQLPAPNGCIRVRKKTEDGKVEYILTAKAWKEGSSKKLECEQETTGDMFDVFKMISEKGMTKTRYKIETDNGEWEYDVFYDANGVEHEWVKVDLEDSTAGLSDMPVQLDDVFEDQPHNRSTELQDKVSYLYRNYFCS